MSTLAAEGRVARVRDVVSGLLEPVEGKIGFAILAAFLFVVAFGPLLAPYPADELGVGLADEAPSWQFLLGTDGLGRDTLSRLLVGARSVIGLPLLATLIAFAVGGLIGLLAAYKGGLLDTLLGRVIDVLVSLPPLLIVLVIIAAFGSSSIVIVLSVAMVYSPRVARILRGATLGVVGQEYVQAAQARGERTGAILLRELLPNIAPTVLVEFAIRLTFVIIFVATINFLGLGVKPPSPNWGVMIADSRSTILTNPVATIVPTLGIGLLCVAIGLISDAATQRLGGRTESELLR